MENTNVNNNVSWHSFRVNVIDHELLSRRVEWDPKDGSEVRFWFRGFWKGIEYMISEELFIYGLLPTRGQWTDADTMPYKWTRMKLSFNSSIGWGFSSLVYNEEGELRNTRVPLVGFLCEVIFGFVYGKDLGQGCEYLGRLITSDGKKVVGIEDLHLSNVWIIRKKSIKDFYIAKKKELGDLREKKKGKQGMNSWDRRGGILSKSSFLRSKFSWRGFDAISKYLGYLSGAELSRMTGVPVLSLQKGFKGEGVFEGYAGRKKAEVIPGLRCMFGLTGMEGRVYPFENVCESINRLLWSGDLYMQYEWMLARNRGIHGRERTKRDGSVVRRGYLPFKKTYTGIATEDREGFEKMRNRVLKWIDAMDDFMLRDGSFLWDNRYWSDAEFKKELKARVSKCVPLDTEGSEGVLYDRVYFLNWYKTEYIVRIEDWKRIREGYLEEDLGFVSRIGWDIDIEYRSYVKGKRLGNGAIDMVGVERTVMETIPVGGVDVGGIIGGSAGIDKRNFDTMSDWKLWNYGDYYGWILEDMVADGWRGVDLVLERLEEEPDWDQYADMGYESREEYLDSFYKYIGALGGINDFRKLLSEAFENAGL